jgi:hypothetical protein
MTILCNFVPFHLVPFRKNDCFEEMTALFRVIMKIVSTLFRETRSERSFVENPDYQQVDPALFSGGALISFCSAKFSLL